MLEAIIGNKRLILSLARTFRSLFLRGKVAVGYCDHIGEKSDKFWMTGLNQSLKISYLQSCVKTFLLSFQNHPENVLLPTPKMNYGTTTF